MPSGSSRSLDVSNIHDACVYVRRSLYWQVVPRLLAPSILSWRVHSSIHVLGAKTNADVNGYLSYVSAKDCKDKTVDYKYKKAAALNNQTNLFVQWDEELRARKVALSVKDSAYKQSMWDAIKEFKVDT